MGLGSWFLVQGSGFWILDSGFWILDSGFWILGSLIAVSIGEIKIKI